MRIRKPNCCSSSVIENQYLSRMMPLRTSMRSNSGTEWKNSSTCSSVAKPVIIQASRVGYDADTGRFGVYKRHRTDGSAMGDNCGKLYAVLHWYQQEYRHVHEQVLCRTLDDEDVVIIDNQFLDQKRPEGLFLHLNMMVGR